MIRQNSRWPHHSLSAHRRHHGRMHGKHHIDIGLSSSDRYYNKYNRNIRIKWLRLFRRLRLESSRCRHKLRQRQNQYGQRLPGRRHFHCRKCNTLCQSKHHQSRHYLNYSNGKRKQRFECRCLSGYSLREYDYRWGSSPKNQCSSRRCRRHPLQHGTRMSRV